MALRLVGLLVPLVLMGWLATNLRSHLSPGETSVLDPETLLQQAGGALERAHSMTGTYQGVAIEGTDALRLASADAAGYCLQLSWLDGQIYHLRGPGGKPGGGPC